MVAFLNIAGLVVNLAGVILLFRYGMPYRISSDQGDYLVTGSTSVEDAALDNRYKHLGQLGLALIIVGTLAQMAANCIA